MCIVGNLYVNAKDKEYSYVYMNTQGCGDALVISNKEEGKYNNSYIIQKDGKKFILRLNKKYEICYGDFIHIEGEYQKPQIARNYKGFDYSIYLKSKNIYGIIISDKVEIIKEKQISFFNLFINNIRNKITYNIEKLFGKGNEAGLILGLLIGDKSLIDEDVSNSFKDSSLAHVLAISGQHISYIVLAITLLLKSICISKVKRKIITILVLIFFNFLVGFSPSIFRAGTMGILIILSGIIYRKSDIFNNLAISLLIIFLLNPFAIYNVGLWLSYGGVLGIVLFLKKLDINLETNDNILKKLKDILLISVSAQIMIIPIMIINFNKISLMFWLSNLLTSPIVAICIILGFVIVFISFIQIKIANFLAIPIKFLIQILINIADLISKIPFSNLLITTPSLIWVIVYYLLLIIFINHAKQNKREYMIEKKIKKSIMKNYKKLLLMIIVLILVIYVFQIFTRQLNIYFVNVGQGDCTLIVTKTRKTILIDGGGNDSYDVGENILIPYLLDRGISTVDYIIISHFDSDHVRADF
ncbi:MAG: ComEC/Rec2 family competence protein [Clostridia bacterium]|nr:ComEC/Rec2 family competence protein [Clostridia bacterium]